MLNAPQLPDLSFPNVKFGARETPWDLTVLLYKGCADASTRRSHKLINSGTAGTPQLDRIALVVKLHEEISAALGSGGSRWTASQQVQVLRYLFGFADRTGRTLTLETATDAYCGWAETLFHRTRARKRASTNSDLKPISMRSAYACAAVVGTLLDSVLGRHTNIVELTRLKAPQRRKTAIGVQAEKQSLADTFAFGHLLQDICDGLSLATTLADPLPVQIALRSGKTLVRQGNTTTKAISELAHVPAERYALANLRIESELLMFIAQTGMNLTQAAALTLRNFFYVSHLDGYQVKDHKARRGGAVLFEIFQDYKPHFERYLEWRRRLFPQSPGLFPLIGFDESRPDRRVSCHRLRAACSELNVAFVSPRMLRNTRINWLLRVTADPDITAEMAQHTKETLLSVYERPSLQRAMVEAARFWSQFDPHSTRTQAVAPGDCTGTPRAVAMIPSEAPKPNCARTSGCLWCENHRDVDSLDYLWALTSFKHLKTIELSKARLPQRDDESPPAKLVIDRIHDKLRWFEQSSEVRREWVAEALARVAEGDFHLNFRAEIAELEGGA